MLSLCHVFGSHTAAHNRMTVLHVPSAFSRTICYMFAAYCTFFAAWMSGMLACLFLRPLGFLIGQVFM